jgi:hypothetical protein
VRWALPGGSRRARGSTRVRSPAGSLPTARAARPAASHTPPRLPETSALPVVHSRPRAGGMPRSRRMTKGGVREAPSRARWTRAATWADLRRVRGPRLPPDHPAPQDARRAQGRPQAADLRAGTWTFAGADYQRKATKRRRPTGVQVRLPVGQGRSAAPAGPARVEPLDRPVPGPKALSSASPGDSRTSGRCHRSASMGWIGCRCTPT